LEALLPSGIPELHRYDAAIHDDFSCQEISSDRCLVSSRKALVDIFSLLAHAHFSLETTLCASSIARTLIHQRCFAHTI